MTAEELAEYARELVADWPPLTKQQRDQLAMLLSPEEPISERLAG